MNEDNMFHVSKVSLWQYCTAHFPKKKTMKVAIVEASQTYSSISYFEQNDTLILILILSFRFENSAYLP